MTTLERPRQSPAQAVSAGALPMLVAIAAAVTALHLFSNSRYGFHRDELQFFSDAFHLDWGFVVYPPVTPVLARIALSLFGLSLPGLRLFPVLAQDAAIILTGLIARALGGRRAAQVTAALTVAVAPMSLHYGTEFIYSSFDYLWWIVAAYFVVRLLKSENPRWWLPIGATLGIGLMTKYTILAFACGILCGFLFTSARRYLRSGWFWTGITLALLIVLPNLLWQVRHQFITAHSLHAIHLRDIGIGRADGFLRDQFFVCTNVFAAPIWIAGLITCFRSAEFRRYRPLAWMYLIPLALLMLSRARGYYLAPAYPMLLAMGAVTGERWLATLARSRQRIINAVFFAGLAAYGLLCCAALLPLASGGPLRTYALARNWDLRDEVGWDNLVKTVAGIRDALPVSPPGSIGILAGNYGNASAIEILGPAYHLPQPISGMNSGWLRGYPQPAPTTWIVVGFSNESADSLLTACRLAGQLTPSDTARNDEFLLRPSIFVCGSPRQPWPEFWKQMRSFG
jgi:hypothetical protein